MLLGLKRGTVIVEPHNSEWEISATKMINTIKSILKKDAADIQPIGSTAIKSIYAKPIVDIAVGVRSFDKILHHNDELSNAGIVYRGQDLPQQHLYVCGDFENDIQTHFIHVVIFESEQWNNYINMRDYLNCHEDMAKRYEALKRSLAEKYPNDRNAYTNAKSEMIEEILKYADEWQRKTDSA